MKLVQPKLIKIVFFSTENNQKLKSLIDTKELLKIGPFLPKVGPLCPKIGPKPWAVDKSSHKG